GAMFRNRNQLLRFKPQEGMQVLVRCRVSLYEPRGEYQLIAESMEEAGDGALQRAFEELKRKLDHEGLFRTEHKLPLPALPRRIGVVTSPSGAAIRDVLSVLKRRFPAIPVLVYPVPVQGKDAGRDIAATLQQAGKRRDCDVLILTRGGGSLEDLWSFNEEAVARAIFDCPLPIISAVGHEVDFTIADFVADQRAATPSAAAELASPDQYEWLARLANLEARSSRYLQQHLLAHRQQLNALTRRLQLRHPGQYLRQQAQRMDELEQRMRLAMRARINSLRTRLGEALGSLRQATPLHAIRRAGMQREALAQRLHAAMAAQLQQRQRRLAVACKSLDTTSPLATLDRGYAIVTQPQDKRILHSTAGIKPGAQIEARLAQGRLLCTVDAVSES
ncbi:MAG: exodeoxyribonuclease VII large subunit, partial [Gammaproteobacteria bacterium]